MATLLYSSDATAPTSTSPTFLVQGQTATGTSTGTSTGAVTNTTTTTQTKNVLTPESKNWATYWEKQNPQAWSLVWDESVKSKSTFYENLKTNTPVYYSFDNTLSQAKYAKDGLLTPVSASQKDNIKKALDELTKATGVQFVEAADANKSKATMVISLADLGGTTYGQNQLATVNGQTQHTVMLNSNWYGTDPKNPSKGADPLTPGGTGYEALLHELAHSAGLDDANTNQKGQLGQKFPELDSLNYTIMSYDDQGVKKSLTTYTKLDKEALAIIYPPAMRPASNTLLSSGSGSPVLLSGQLASQEELLLEKEDGYDPDDPDYIAALDEVSTTPGATNYTDNGASGEGSTAPPDNQGSTGTDNTGTGGSGTDVWEDDAAVLLADSGNATAESRQEGSAAFMLKGASPVDPASLLAPRIMEAASMFAVAPAGFVAPQPPLEKQTGVLAQS